MATTIELKEQMKVLRFQQREAEKKVNKIKKDFKIWKMLMTDNHSFCYANNWKGKYRSFEELITEQDWRPTHFRNREEWEFLFQELEFEDIEFFTTFMSWSPAMFNIPIADRKCCICLTYYNSSLKEKKKFANCSHAVCKECYNQVKKVNGYKNCVICRESEKPK